MKNHIFPAFRLTVVMLVVIGVYLLIVYGGSKVLPTQGNAETITHNGQKFYVNIGQEFKSEKYFHGRPSAVDYKADGSAGSNKGPTNEEYLAVVQKRIDTLKIENPAMGNTKVPVELITASGSGLDPNISEGGALYQAKRVAKERNLPESSVIELIKKHTDSPLLNMFGPSKVNVLELNIALDELK
ncbi:K+-transporting ATPase ATPase C chain [Chryseobacterium sp. H1D6B]|uniref:K(+)-transporting ATPase subunit C n=1 Tax=Chryseobacterium sp. H1D6B TaxID=2940588 RepID=UPI0015CB47A4|nr:K(+)-transporting ATPase subunit C [Chryseobacterium sp. H1D6B]MDH6252817.1 K+-transporting ATPase ATPase C chain [Chryseobacterium sp. H1D6B]